MIVKLLNNKFDPNGYWSIPIPDFIPTIDDLALFDQNGYDLTELEKQFARVNLTKTYSHRRHRTAIKQYWFMQDATVEGAHLNHSQLFERKGYTGNALAQLESWSHQLPLVHKLTAMRPKWGLDFSMDYVDRQGNAFELLHWEWDSFDYNEISQIKSEAENILADIDWDDAANGLLLHKKSWYHLDFFKQSEWKCKYFGITNERFKMVIWN